MTDLTGWQRKPAGGAFSDKRDVKELKAALEQAGKVKAEK